MCSFLCCYTMTVMTVAARIAAFYAIRVVTYLSQEYMYILVLLHHVCCVCCIWVVLQCLYIAWNSSHCAIAAWCHWHSNKRMCYSQRASPCQHTSNFSREGQVRAASQCYISRKMLRWLFVWSIIVLTHVDYSAEWGACWQQSSATQRCTPLTFYTMTVTVAPYVRLVHA